MSLKTNLFRFAATLAIVIVAILLAMLNVKSKDIPEIVTPVVQQPTVVAMTVSPEAHTPILKSTSSVEAWQESQLASQVTGRLEWICDCLESGNTVKKDTVLARIESVDYKVAVAQAKQALADAKTQIAEEQARSEQALADWTDLNLGEPSELALRKPQLEAANATLQRRQLELQQANRNLRRTQIKAPYAGVITERSANIGNFVNIGNSIGKILNTDKVQINLALNAKDINKLDDTNTEVILSSSGNNTLKWFGNIVRIDSMIDTKTRLVNVIAEVEKPFDLTLHPAPLRVGEFVSAELTGKPIEGTYDLPASAVLTDNSVFIVTSDNELNKLTASVQHRNSDSVLVTFNDMNSQAITVVTEGQAALSQGLKVNVLNSDSFAAGQ